MSAERDALQRNVFPRLRELCLSHGTTFLPIDLRWGVSQSAAENQRTMGICFAEIDRCCSQTRRPNFIGLLGDRYGWLPLPSQIPVPDFDALQSHLTHSTLRLLRSWYRVDTNAVPNAYRLLPRARDSSAESRLRNERELVLSLADAAARSDLPSSVRLKFGTSATEQELAHRGLLDPNRQEQGVFFFLKDFKTLPPTKQACDFLDVADDGSLDEDSFHEQKMLKQSIRDRFKNTVFNYQVAWKENQVTTDHLEQLCSDAYTALSNTILDELSKSEFDEPLTAEVAAHRAFARERRAAFIGRAEPLEAIQQYLSRPAKQPFLVHGESGSGKSTLLAQVVGLLEKTGSKDVVYRAIGVTPESTSIGPLFRGLCKEMAELSGASLEDTSTPVEELFSRFETCLRQSTQPLVILIDAVDQLNSQDPILEFFTGFLHLPDAVHLIISSTTQSLPQQVKTRTVDTYLRPLSRFEGDVILDAWLRDAGRQIEPAQKEEILRAFSVQGLPLFLRLAYEECKNWHSDDPIVSLPNDVASMISILFERLSSEANHGPTLVSRSLAYLTAGKHGLTQEEILDVLSGDPAVMRDFVSRNPLAPRVDRLPVVVWSRLFNDLEPYMTEQSNDGVLAIQFYHRQLREVAVGVYLADRQDRHQALADYFGQQSTQWHTQKGSISNLRKLSEWPFQLANAGNYTEFTNALMDFSFLKSKIAAFGTDIAIEDFELIDVEPMSTQVQDQLIDIRHLRTVRCALQLSANALDEAPDQLAPHLVGRLMEVDSPAVRELLHRIIKEYDEPWLRPIARNLIPTGTSLIRTINTGTDSGETVAITPDGQYVLAPTDGHCIAVWSVQSGRKVRVLSGHSDLVRGIALDANGTRVVSVAEDNTLRCWKLSSGQCERTFTSPRLSALAVAITPDGERAITVDEETEIAIWNPLTSDVRVVSGNAGTVGAITFTADARQIVSASWDNTLCVWDVESGELIRQVQQDGIWGSAVVATRDNRFVIAPAEDGTIAIRSLRDLEIVASLPGHDDVIQALDMSQDQTRLFSASRDKTVREWDLRTGRLVRTLAGHTDEVTALAVTPDGEHLISADKTCRVWQLSSGKVRTVFEGHDNQVESIAAASDGWRVFSTSIDHEVLVWDARTGDHLKVLHGSTEGVRRVVPAPHGQLVSLAAGSCKIWDLSGGTVIRTLRRHAIADDGVACSSDGKRIAVTLQQYPLRVWDLATGENTRTLRGHTQYVRAISIAPEGTAAVSTSWDSKIKVWSLKSGKSLRTIRGHGFTGEALALIPEGKLGLAATDDEAILEFDVATGKASRLLHGHSDLVTSISVPTGNRTRAIAGSRDRTVGLWDLKSGQLVKQFCGHSNAVNDVATPSSGNIAASVSLDHTVRVWDLQDSAEQAVAGRGHSDFVRAIALSADGKISISASDDETIRIWDLQTGTQTMVLNEHRAQVWVVAVAPNERIVSGAQDGSIKVWSLRTGRHLRTLVGHTESITAIRITSSGKQVISASYDDTVRVWDLRSGRIEHTLSGHVGFVMDVAATPNGNMALSACGDGTLRVWDLCNGELSGVLTGHNESVEHVKVSPDGLLAVSGGMNDSCLRVWNLHTLREHRVISTKFDSVGSIIISPDGLRVVCASDNSWDANIQVFELGTGDLLHSFRGHRDMICGLSLSSNGRTLASVSLDHWLHVWDIDRGEYVAGFFAEGGLSAVAMDSGAGTIVAGQESGQIHFVQLQRCTP